MPVLAILWGFLSGLSPKTQIILGTCVAVSVGLLWFHHAAIKGEDAKIMANTYSTVLTVQEKKDEIRNRPSDDRHTIDRLLRGSF